jgi:hypothetical protein
MAVKTTPFQGVEKRDAFFINSLFLGDMTMTTTSDAHMLAQFGQNLSEIQAELAGFAGKVTNRIPGGCDTPVAKQVFEQAERLSSLLKQCAELAGQTGAVAKQEASRILGGG